jgi:hypothetical protein
MVDLAGVTGQLIPVQYMVTAAARIRIAKRRLCFGTRSRRAVPADMKVRHRQQLGLPIRAPGQSLAVGTVTVAARVVSDARCATIITLLDMAPEHRRPAVVMAPMTGRSMRPRRPGRAQEVCNPPKFPAEGRTGAVSQQPCDAGRPDVHDFERVDDVCGFIQGIGGLELAVPLGHYHCAKALAPGPWTGRRCGQEAGIGTKLDEHRRGARS